MTKPGYPPCLLDVVEEHFEELDFLWEQREGVVFAPDWTVEDLAELEERAEAHLDGLRLAERHAVDLALPFLQGEETFAATAATFVLMETREQALADAVLDALEAGATPEARDGIRIGLRHAGIDGVRERLIALADATDPALALAASDVLAFHRVDAPELERLVDVEGPAERALAWTALGRLGRVRDVTATRRALEDADPAVGTAALRAAAMSGAPGLEAHCRAAALHPGQPSLAAVGLLGLFGAVEDLPLLEACARDAECAAVAIPAIGALGRVQALPLLIELMGEGGDGARAAAAAFTRITGFPDLDGERPPPRDAQAIDEEFEDDAPAPDPGKAQAWWERHGAALDPDVRHRSPVETLLMRRDRHLYDRATRPEETPDLELEQRVRALRHAS